VIWHRHQNASLRADELRRALEWCRELDISEVRFGLLKFQLSTSAWIIFEKLGNVNENHEFNYGARKIRLWAAREKYRC